MMSQDTVDYMQECYLSKDRILVWLYLSKTKRMYPYTSMGLQAMADDIRPVPWPV